MLLAGLLPAGFLFVLLLFVPESPRWLAKQGQSAAALDILTCVNGRETAVGELAEIEAALSEESESIGQLFQRGRRLPLLIGIVLPFFSQISGINVIVYYGPTVLKTAGWGENAALSWQILFGAVAAVFTMVAILMIDRLGRKPLLLLGIAGVGIMLTAAGALMAMENVSPVWLIVVFALDLAFFNISYGPICWVIVSEIFPTSIRGRAMSISIFSLWIGCALVAQTFPLLLDRLGAAHTFWLYALTTPVALLFVLFLVPETKGKSLEQIERQFAHHP
jgi:SP family arabinose:H+ symporter-like MFS transporter